MESIDKNNICRLCLLSSDDLTYIFEVNVRNGFVAAELIKDLLQFKVLEDDGYPNVVCPTCLSKLTDFQHFKEQCQTYKVTYDNVFSSNEELMDCPSEPATNPLEEDPSETEEDVPPQFEFGSIKKEPEEITVEEERPLKIDYDAVCSDKGEEIANYIPIQPCSSTALSGPRKEVPSQTPLTTIKAEPAETSEEGETSRTSEQGTITETRIESVVERRCQTQGRNGGTTETAEHGEDVGPCAENDTSEWYKQCNVQRAQPSQRLRTCRANQSIKELLEKRARRMERRSSNQDVRTSKNSDEERGWYLERMRSNRAKQRSEETPEKRAIRLDKMRVYQAKKVRNESPEERERRLERKRAYYANKFRNETPEERESRLDRRRARRAN